MRGVKEKKQDGLFHSFSTDSPVVGYGVSKVVDSGSPEFKEGNLVWGPTTWEECSLFTNLDTLGKIEHTVVDILKNKLGFDEEFQLQRRTRLGCSFKKLYSKFLEHTLPYVREGKIVYMEEENEGIESGPGALERLFTGQITGKGIIVVARD
ncbi:2-alkenal reductase (NADP(+)-dependent)-like [Manihot esculenta]|uniref:2-alkenal reductase (NADP(+)-dependent)-like n=1 Tax=Manihot esculenta TaxID=3983 RepID=UPI000B5D12B2|nr:2-alkenal reductase (NADP(+)-dependent)-like [Manihot esculenta]